VFWQILIYFRVALITKYVENCIMISFIVVLFIWYCKGDKIKEDEMDSVCSYGWQVICNIIPVSGRFNWYSVVGEQDFFKSVSQILRWGGVSWKLYKLSIYIILQLPRSTITSHNTAHMYNKGHTIKISTNVVLCTMSKASMQASNVLAVEVWLTS
jgi:hypothetical protein